MRMCWILPIKKQFDFDPILAESDERHRSNEYSVELSQAKGCTICIFRNLQLACLQGSDLLFRSIP